MFERTFKPLYERLEVVAKEYHGIVQHALSRLQHNNPDLEFISNQMQAKRAALVIARNGVIGEAFAFTHHYGVLGPRASLLSFCPVESTGEFEKLVLEFAHSVTVYFQCANEYLEGDHSRDKLNWLATKLELVAQASATSYISRLGDDMKLAFRLRRRGTQDSHDEDLRSIRYKAAWTLRELENNWETVSMRFAALRLFCEA